MNAILYFDKYTLTTNVALEYSRNMNANEISPKTNPRLDRIKCVSRIVRYVVLANLVYHVCVFFVVPPGFKLGLPEYSMRSILNILLLGVLVYWFSELARLFRFYER